MAAQEYAGIDVRRYGSVIMRHLVLIVICTLGLGLAAYAYSASKTPMYEASALLLYEPQLDITNPLDQGYSDPNTQELQLQSAVTVVTGPEIRGRVDQKLGGSDKWPLHDVTAAIATSDAQSSNATGNGVRVVVTSSSPELAARLANAHAQQFVDWRVETERARIAAAETVIEAKLRDFTTPAEQASTDFVLLSERLRDLQIYSSTATGNFSVAVPATTPSTPYAPQPRRSAVMGAVLGLGFGIALAFLREKLDTRLRSYREVGDMMDLPVVGRIPVIPPQSLQRGPLVVVSEAEGRAAESLRALRSNIEFVSLGSEKRILMVVSAQKGEGKSLVIANLAASLALSGKKVVLIDADLRRPRVHSVFSVPNTRGVSSVIAGIATLEDSLQSVTPLNTTKVRMGGGNGDRPKLGDDNYGTEARLWLLPSGPIPPNPGEMVASQRFHNLVTSLADMSFDYVLVDSPAFMSVGDATALATCVDGILLLVNMNKTRRPILEEARDFLALLPAPRLGVITVADQSAGDERYHYYARD